jgi:hypothetical protein
MSINQNYNKSPIKENDQDELNLKQISKIK